MFSRQREERFSIPDLDPMSERPGHSPSYPKTNTSKTSNHYGHNNEGFVAESSESSSAKKVSGGVKVIHGESLLWFNLHNH